MNRTLAALTLAACLLAGCSSGGGQSKACEATVTFDRWMADHPPESPGAKDYQVQLDRWLAAIPQAIADDFRQWDANSGKVQDGTKEAEANAVLFDKFNRWTKEECGVELY